LGVCLKISIFFCHKNWTTCFCYYYLLQYHHSSILNLNR